MTVALVVLGPPAGANAARPDVPPANVDLDDQLGGKAKPAANVGIVVRDRMARPSAADYNICYVIAFQTQPDAKQLWKRHSDLVMSSGGRPVVDEAWGEKILDIRSRAKRKALDHIVGRWITGCARHGYRAVEFDNLDSYRRWDGLIKKRQTKKYAAKLVRRAHRADLAAGQENRAEWDRTAVGFDFAIAEECGRWKECGRSTGNYVDRVFVIEYRRKDFIKTCASAGDRLSVVLRDLDLSPDSVHDWC